MIIGNGLIGKKLKEHQWDDQYLFYASGVANSKASIEQDFLRESELIKDTLDKYQNKTFVYFSTNSIYEKGMPYSDYINHKLKMEELVSTMAKDYRLVRVSNIVGNSANKATILEFIFNSINREKKFELWEGVERNLIDVDDFIEILQKSLIGSTSKNIIHIHNKFSIEVMEIVEIIEVFLNKAAQTKIIKNNNVLNQNKLVFPESGHIENFKGFFSPRLYLEGLLKKYYA